MKAACNRTNLKVYNTFDFEPIRYSVHLSSFNFNKLEVGLFRHSWTVCLLDLCLESVKYEASFAIVLLYGFFADSGKTLTEFGCSDSTEPVGL